MVDGVVRERLREGRRLWTIGGGGGGLRVRWQQRLVDDGGVESTSRVGCGEAGERRQWGGRLMGSGGCVRSKGVVSGRWMAAGEGVETSGSSNYGDIL